MKPYSPTRTCLHTLPQLVIVSLPYHDLNCNKRERVVVSQTKLKLTALPGLVITKCHDQQLDHNHTMTYVLITVKKLKPNKSKLNHGSLPYHDLNCNQRERYVARLSK